MSTRHGCLAAAVAVAAGLAAPILLVTAMLAALSAAVGPTATGPVQLDQSKLPPLARELLPLITQLTAERCPELPPPWVIAQVSAESSWNPTAFSHDSNGGAAGLYQMNEANWVAAGGKAWPDNPPPPQSDILNPRRHLEVAIPFVCGNVRVVTAHLAHAAKPTTPLDAMLVCHIAGCQRVTDSATGVPDAGEAGCDSRCANLVDDYIANVHRYLDGYAATAGPVDISHLAAPAPFAGTSGRCSEPDPTTSGCLTPATRHTLDEVFAVFGPPSPSGPIRAATCWDPHLHNPRSDHPKGRACDLFPTSAGTFPAGTDLENGWGLATWLRAHAPALRVRYLIWQGRYWHPQTPDEDGWGKPYNGGGVYDPTDVTGGHYDHLHVSVE